MTTKHATRRTVAGILVGIVVGACVGGFFAYAGGSAFGTPPFGWASLVCAALLAMVGGVAGSVWDE
jgi:hypothetical protein